MRCLPSFKACFNGATPFQTWKLYLCWDVRSLFLLSFNGATPFQTWKLIYPDMITVRADLLQWGHAFSDVEI